MADKEITLSKENDESKQFETSLDEEQTTDVLAKYDREFAFRRLQGPIAWFCFLLAVGWSLFHLYTAYFGTLPGTLQRAPHVGAALVLIYLIYPAKRGSKSNTIPWYDYILALASFVVSAYHVVFYKELIWRAGLYTDFDMWIGLVAIVLIIEATRRLAGPVLISLAIFFLGYAYFGDYFPGFMQHQGLSIKRIAVFQWLGSEGILGIPIYVSSTFIFLFMLFATFLKKTGIGDWMTNVAIGLTGRATGGPAKAAVIASAVQGTISGSSVANTVGTGSVTIPLMKSIGYRKEFAGAVEATASTGGQLMPPIMGAAAFIMIEFLNVPYTSIVAAAAIPALLYFTGVFTTVHFEAVKTGLTGMPKERMPDVKQLLRKWFLALPIAAIIYLLVKGFTPTMAAFWGIVSCVVASMILKETRMTIRKIITALEEGARSALPVVAACATAGIIVGIITLSGLGLKLAGGIVSLAGGSLILTMVFTMLCSILLGMGVPTTANYIIQATVSAPALVMLGVEPIAAHLFVFYFGIVADITPPVALAAFAGSGIAGSDPLKTGVEAFKLGFAAYLVPYMFVLSPVLVLVRPEGVTTFLFVFLVVKAVVTAIIGMTAIGGSTTGYFMAKDLWYERIILFVGGVTLVNPELLTDIVGFILVATIWFLQKQRNKTQKPSISV